ncbi:MAG: hypothetical protein HN929_01420 [Chloroflexi bacterium]|jgi:hypothetical protein|nr:hypothetical protein [Chloroflexota bacterium]MBT7080122.1 hypothetical protein [Chloroflexota bacterium]MBT7290200.1 hypothetical protein [Chloroflexota bacterium]
MKRLFAFILISGLIAGMGCNTAPEESTYVPILTPSKNAELKQGESVLVKYLVEVDHEIEWMQVTLWDVGDLNNPVQIVNPDTGRDVNSGEHTWTFEPPSQSQTFTFEETIEIPSDAPPGGNYRLHVEAMNSWGGSGYSLKVKVIAA